MIQSTISLLRSMNISQSCWIQNAHQCQRESNSVFSSFSHCRLFLIHPCLPPLLKQPENCQLYHNFYLLHFQDHPHIYILCCINLWSCQRCVLSSLLCFTIPVWSFSIPKIVVFLDLKMGASAMLVSLTQNKNAEKSNTLIAVNNFEWSN